MVAKDIRPGVSLRFKRFTSFRIDLSNGVKLVCVIEHCRVVSLALLSNHMNYYRMCVVLRLLQSLLYLPVVMTVNRTDVL